MNSRRWHFSLVLLGTYVAVFHFWLERERGAVLASTALAVTALTLYGALACRRGYFRNRWDQAFHGAVVLDILLEGWLIRRHEDHGFYLCALAFVLVVGGYHRRRT